MKKSQPIPVELERKAVIMQAKQDVNNLVGSLPEPPPVKVEIDPAVQAAKAAKAAKDSTLRAGVAIAKGQREQDAIVSSAQVSAKHGSYAIGSAMLGQTITMDAFLNQTSPLYEGLIAPGCAKASEWEDIQDRFLKHTPAEKKAQLSANFNALKKQWVHMEHLKDSASAAEQLKMKPPKINFCQEWFHFPIKLNVFGLCCQR